jgi:3-hydroxyacyl-[acyl-carrier-protein] dehydratase
MSLGQSTNTPPVSEIDRAPGGPAIGPFQAIPIPAVDGLRARPCAGGLVLSVTKVIDGEDPYMAAHFPGRTIYPGVFVLETVRQGVVAALGENDGQLVELRAIGSLRLIAAMHPGEQLCVEATVLGPDEHSAYQVEARCVRADGSDVARMSLEFGYGYGDRGPGDD